LRINLHANDEVRRFCEVHIKGSDVYVFQPRKGQSVKISYHESGQRHLKIGNAPAMFVRQEGHPGYIREERRLWSKSFENFSKLLMYEGQPADDLLRLELPSLSCDRLHLAEISIGNDFSPQGWVHEDVSLRMLEEHLFKIRMGFSSITICVRSLVLSTLTQGTSLSPDPCEIEPTRSELDIRDQNSQVSAKDAGTLGYRSSSFTSVRESN